MRLERAGALFVALALAAGCGGDDDADERPNAKAGDARAGTPLSPEDRAKREDGRAAGTQDAERRPRGGGRRDGGRDGDGSSASRGTTNGSNRAADRDGRSDRKRRRSRRRGSPGRADTMTHAQVVTAGDRLCSTLREQIRSLPDEGRSTDALARRTGRLLEFFAATTREFAALRAPAAGRENFDAYVDRLRAQEQLLGELKQAAERGDRQAISTTYQAINGVGDQAKQHARAYGFKVCGSAA